MLIVRTLISNKMCKKVRKECELQFCPGPLMKGHTTCLINCGGNLCKEMFIDEDNYKMFIAGNDLMLKNIKQPKI